ncbi:MAG TPA: hypothetical protein VLL08_11540 [Kineosporiaceae bacterium]|nr:hypothetical protein [Kineosporiaceae bacterium]
MADKRPSRPATATKARPHLEPWVIAAVFFGLYLAVGAVLVLHYNSIPADAMSRVANGSYVYRGADPHLAAVGFVWNPLPSILAIPLLLASDVWPALLTQAFAGNILSAAVMALCVAVLNGLLRDLGLRRAPRLALTLLFGLTPMIVYYGANGMSEAYLLLAQVVAARALLSWTRSGTRAWRQLVVAGTALGLGYFTRYEALVTAAGAVAFVTLVAYGSASGPRSVRLRLALADSWLIGLPAAGAFAAWAGLSWVTVGKPFEQFSSSYGNSSQVAQQGLNGSSAPGPIAEVITTGLQIVTLEPLLVIVCLLAVVMLINRRDVALLVPFTIFVPVLAFQAIAAIGGSTFGWWRFYIDAIPLTVILLGLLITAGSRSVSATPAMADRPTARRPVARAAIAAGAALVLLAPFGSQALAVQDDRIAKEENPHFDLIVHPDRPVAIQLHRRFQNEHQIAAYLDAKQLPSQSILVDVASGFAIVMASRRPESFVITTDRQFRAALDGIGDNQVQYILDVPNEARGLGTSNAVNVKYPSFYRDGGGVAVLDREFPQTSDQPSWRLYRVIPSAAQDEPAASEPDTKVRRVVPHQKKRLTVDPRKVRKVSKVITRRSTARPS